MSDTKITYQPKVNIALLSDIQAQLHPMDSQFRLTNMRHVMRGKAPYENHFICDKFKINYGVWINIDKYRNMPQEQQIELLKELMSIMS